MSSSYTREVLDKFLEESGATLDIEPPPLKKKQGYISDVNAVVKTAKPLSALSIRVYFVRSVQ
jgi:hypothetical protein